jgi:WhiB family redox-sensing transcriptional regulator
MAPDIADDYFLARRAKRHLGWAADTKGTLTWGEQSIDLGGQQMSAQEDTTTREELKWWALGACKGLDSAVFYPDDEASAVFAKAVCGDCAVRSTCLEHALDIREKAGVWGGATERDRRRIIRQRRKSA